MLNRPTSPREQSVENRLKLRRRRRAEPVEESADGGKSSQRKRRARRFRLAKILPAEPAFGKPSRLHRRPAADCREEPEAGTARARGGRALALVEHATAPWSRKPSAGTGRAWR